MLQSVIEEMAKQMVRVHLCLLDFQVVRFDPFYSVLMKDVAYPTLKSQ